MARFSRFLCKHAKMPTGRGAANHGAKKQKNRWSITNGLMR
jgi:hypothetical protein